MSPDDFTNHEFYIDVGDEHQLYVHDWGNKKAKQPILYLHGGPGGHSTDGHRLVFDPEQHRVIFFDQRGCGKSTPYGSIEHNTTDNTLEDITQIADYLRLKQFVLVGPSWGSTLALAYAIKYPKRVSSLVLQGVYTASSSENDWLLGGLHRVIFPESWDRYLARTPKKYHDDPTAYHLKTILEGSDNAAAKSALALSDMERTVLNFDDRFQPQDPITFDPTGSKIFAHYAANNMFLPDRHILKNAGRIATPTWIVHGRYDMGCPPVTAYRLHQKLPNSKLIWIATGHRTGERAAYDVLKTILLQFN